MSTRFFSGLIDGIYKGLERNKNITFITGKAEFTSPVDIRVDGKSITAEKIILAVGSCPFVPNIPGLDEAGYITNYEALRLGELPESMVIIGGGYIGVEFAQMYSRFGTKVTLLGRAPRLMKKEEPELSESLSDILSQECVDVYTSAEVLRVGIEDNKRYVIANINNKERRFESEVILLAAGHIARVDDLDLEQAGVVMDGVFIKANDQLRTSTENIWSLGDANGGYMFTHRATYDGPIAVLNAIKNVGKEINYRVVPRAVFSEPALASVGMTAKKAKEAGYEVRTGKAFFKH